MFTAVHRAESVNGNADALSRASLESNELLARDGESVTGSVEQTTGEGERYVRMESKFVTVMCVTVCIILSRYFNINKAIFYPCSYHFIYQTVHFIGQCGVYPY